MRGVVLLLAAGRGSRLNCGPKAFVEIGGVPILRRSAEAAAAASLVDGIVVAVPPGAEPEAGRLLDGLDARWTLVAGGATRQASAFAALAAAADAHAVAVHDAARALCPPALFDRCLAALDDAEAVVATVPVADTVKEVDGDLVVRTLDRSRLGLAQTPQAFRTDVYRRAHAAAMSEGREGTDDAALVEHIGVHVRAVEGDPANIKITTAVDLELAERLLRARAEP